MFQWDFHPLGEKTSDFSLLLHETGPALRNLETQYKDKSKSHNRPVVYTKGAIGEPEGLSDSRMHKISQTNR